jgi:ABC-type glycerol-3-phosphate transport system permease component
MGYDAHVKKFLLYAVLIVGGILMLVPFYWMFVLSTHSTTDILSFPPPLLPGDQGDDNYLNLIQAMPFYQSFWNSIFTSGAHTILALIFCSMGGYAFAMYDFPGKKYLFGFCLVTMMVPWMAGIVPWFMLMKWFGWIDNLAAIIIPGVANAFGIFWMRQYISNTIDKSLIDAARIDGCPEWQIFFRVIMPVLKPAISALGIFTFVQTWNNFIVPLVVLKSDNKLTLPVALNRLYGDPSRGFDIGVLMMGTSLAVLPLMIVFIFASRRFIDGMTAGAMKG